MQDLNDLPICGAYKTMKRRISIILFFNLLLTVLSAQTLKQFERAAKAAIKKQEYGEALYFLDKIQEIDTTKIALQYLQAEAARQYNAFQLAEKRYQQVLESEAAKEYPEAIFWQAAVQKMQGRYDDAIEGFNRYLVENKDTTAYLYQEALSQIQQCNWAKELIKFRDDDLTIDQLDESINSPYSDFAPVKYRDSLLFSALKFQSKNNKSEQKFSKILKIKEGDFEAHTYDLGLSNDEVHTAHIAFNQDQSRQYFNICQYVEGNIIECKIYYRQKYANEWSPALKLDASINPDQTTSTQPNIGYDEVLNQEILFFVSNRPGGKGGMDIWYSYLDEEGMPETPRNLQSVNSNKDEFSPFFHDYTQTLYFSSDGRKSLGGHDIYKAKWQEGQSVVSDHTGFPLNSSYNDVYFSLSKDGSEGYFASNREGTQFLEKEISACCYDIFKANFNSYLLDLKILTFLEDGASKEPLKDVTVTVYELFEDVEKEVLMRIEPVGNEHFYRINSNKKYRIVAEKNGLYSEPIFLNTEAAPAGKEIVREISLFPPDLKILTFNTNLNTPLDSVDVRLFQLDKSGNEISISPLRKAEGNAHYFPLSINKDYKLVATRFRFEGIEELFSTRDLQTRERTITRNVILQQEQNLTLRRLKPFPLYFDNDQPNPNSKDTITQFAYPFILAQYKRRKEEFKRGYSRNLRGTDRQIAQQKVEKFFETEIDSSFQQFIEFTDAVLERLTLKRGVKISVQAYTSPLASEDYNLRLSKRRISSMLNFYRTYKDGAMKEYVDSGKLSIEMIPHGESQAPKSISDNPNDRRNSVYGLEASKERKVVIKEVATRRTIDRTKTGE